MCRWAAWIGAPIYLGDLVVEPDHSLIAQSRAADQCKTATNGDGFGLAWYDTRPEPGLYRDTYPAWGDPNLHAICTQVRSRLFLAHVRASTGSAISRNNCHPFAYDRWSFMHNGQIGGFERFRKQVDMAIPDALYPHRKGATDSEALFLLALANGLTTHPERAMAQTVAGMEDLSRGHGQAPHMRMSAAFSDGQSLWAVRYASDHLAPSLWSRQSELGWVVASEPLDTAPGWREMDANTITRFDPNGAEIMPFQPGATRQAA